MHVFGVCVCVDSGVRFEELGELHVVRVHVERVEREPKGGEAEEEEPDCDAVELFEVELEEFEERGVGSQERRRECDWHEEGEGGRRGLRVGQSGTREPSRAE